MGMYINITNSFRFVHIYFNWHMYFNWLLPLSPCYWVFENIVLIDEAKQKIKSSWWDLNPQSLVPKTSAFSIRPQKIPNF